MLGDFNKCGSEMFVFEILEVTLGTKEERLAREQFYLDQFYDKQNQCYNLRKEAHTPEGTFPKDTFLRKQQRSEAFKRTWTNSIQREKMTNAMKERCQNLEYRKQISNTLKANNQTEAGKAKRQKVGEHNKGRMAKPYALLSPEGKLYEGVNMSVFAQEQQLDIRDISALMTGRRNSAHGWTNANFKQETRMVVETRNFVCETKDKRVSSHEQANILSPEGVLYVSISNVKQFAELHSLDKTHIMALIKNKIHSCNGWIKWSKASGECT